VCDGNKIEGGCCRQDRCWAGPAEADAAAPGCARQWIPAEHISDPVCSLVMGLPDDLVFRTKAELATPNSPWSAGEWRLPY